MSNLDEKRRKVLTFASIGTAAVAVAGVTGALGASMAPSRRTKGEGAPVEVDLRLLEPGRLGIVAWRRKPIWILNRTPAQVAELSQNKDQLSDPESNASDQPDNCKNDHRSIKPELFVAIGICTHLGCSPGINFPEGFLCACHGSYFDLAGRVILGSPAPTNLPIPDHYYPDENTLIVGAAGPS